MSADQRFDELAAEPGCRVDGEIRIGGNYLPLRCNAAGIDLSGQIPRVDDRVVVTGRAVAAASLAGVCRDAPTRTAAGAWKLPENAAVSPDLIAVAG